MYARQMNRYNRGITVPQNYSGSAFKSPLLIDEKEPQEEISEAEPTGGAVTETPEHESEPLQAHKNFLPINIGSEELILIGVMLLLFQGDSNDGIIPILLAILFLGGEDH